MRRPRSTLLPALLLIPVLLLGACMDGDPPTSPASVTALGGKELSTALIPETLKTVTAAVRWWPVVRDIPILTDISASQKIGPKGGTLTAAEVTVTIPRGALSTDTQITMLTLQGDKLYVLFWPHGLKFEKPATLSFDVGATSAKGALASELAGVYFENLFEVVPGALEKFAVSRFGNVVSFEINHFSYYGMYQKRGYTAAGAD